MSGKVYLKVKIKSLAEEAKIIRNEERKALRSRDWEIANEGRRVGAYFDTYYGLRDHRKGVVAKEARAANLAIGYVNGREYSHIEHPLSKSFDYKRVAQLLIKYGNLSECTEKEATDIVEEWYIRSFAEYENQHYYSQKVA